MLNDRSNTAETFRIALAEQYSLEFSFECGHTSILLIGVTTKGTGTPLFELSGTVPQFFRTKRCGIC